MFKFVIDADVLAHAKDQVSRVNFGRRSCRATYAGSYKLAVVKGGLFRRDKGTFEARGFAVGRNAAAAVVGDGAGCQRLGGSDPRGARREEVAGAAVGSGHRDINGLFEENRKQGGDEYRQREIRIASCRATSGRLVRAIRGSRQPSVEMRQ